MAYYEIMRKILIAIAMIASLSACLSQEQVAEHRAEQARIEAAKTPAQRAEETEANKKADDEAASAAAVAAIIVQM